MLNRFGKYNAKKVRDDGFLFDSKSEHKRYLELKLLIKAREISQLEVHPIIALEIDRKPVCRYEADFSYTDMKTGKTVWEDVKGWPTDVFKLKVKLLAILRPDIDLRVLKV